MVVDAHLNIIPKYIQRMAIQKKKAFNEQQSVKYSNMAVTVSMFRREKWEVKTDWISMLL